MKKTKIIYWILTGLFAAFMAFSAIPDILMSDDALKFMAILGYPLYFIPFIGYAKILGVIAILVPGYPRIKEWAYAGLMYDLIGAGYSVAATSGIASAAMFLIFIGLGAASYIYYHKLQKESAVKTL